MKSFFKEFYDSRLGKYLSYCLIYILMWKIFGFEITIVNIGGMILGELDYQFRNRGRGNMADNVYSYVQAGI